MWEYKPFLSGPDRAEENEDDEGLGTSIESTLAARDIHIHKNDDGTWVLRLSENGQGVEISTRYARLMRLALSAQDTRLWEDETDAELEKINCHRTVLYLLDEISRDELTGPVSTGGDYSFEERAQAISDEPFRSYDTYEDLQLAAEEACKDGQLCVGQIGSPNGLLHSFIVGSSQEPLRADSGLLVAKYVCFDKQGFEGHPFRVSELKSLYNYSAYSKAQWRFVPVEDVTEKTG